MSSFGSFVPLSSRWWRASGDQLHTVLHSVTLRLRERQKPRRDLMQLLCEMYGGTEMSGLGLTSYDNTAMAFHPASLPYNVTRSCVETVVARVGKTKPKPSFLTDHGDYSMRKKAKNLERFIDGMFYRLKIYDRSIPVLRDACVFGTGVLSVFRRGDQVHVDRVFPWEILGDLADLRYGSPQNLYMIRWLDKDVLSDLFPDHSEAIHAANITTDDIDHIQDYEATADRILVTEAWHLPSGPEAQDGRHSVIIDGVTLLDEQYTDHRFPFCFLRYKEPIAGFWGNGLGEELMGWQQEINEVSERVQQAHYLVGGGIWLVPDGADIVDTELTNGIGVIVHHKPGMPPDYKNPQPINPATYEYLKDLPNFAMQFSGISQMSAQSKTPSGITAAKALQVLDDVETERFAMLGRAWEAYFLDICDHIIDLCKEIAEEYPGFRVRSAHNKYSIDIKWSDVDMERDAFVMQVFPTALLAKTPAARLQQVQDLFQAGIIDRAMFLRLLDAPDINAEEDLEAAARTVADEQIEFMIDSDDPDEPGAFVYPEPFQDLIYSLHRAQAHYNLGRIQGMDEGHLRLLRNYMGSCKDLLEKQNPPPPPPNGGLPGGQADQLGGPAMVGAPTVAPQIPGMAPAAPPAAPMVIPPGAGSPPAAMPPAPPQNLPS